MGSSAGAGEWRTGLCGCCEDCDICCSVMCCHPITLGQIYERTVQKALIQKLPLLSCMSIALLIWALDIGQQMISNASHSSAIDQLAPLINYGMAHLAGMNTTIRRREGIKPKCCAEIPQCEDVLCAWCCNP